MQSEDRQCLRSRLLQLERQDAGVGQRVAVDLRGQRGRHRSALSRGVGRAELRPRLVDVEGASEGGHRIHGCVLEARQPRQQQVDLHLRALRLGGCGIPEQAGQLVGRDVREHVIAVHSLIAERHLAVGRDRADLGARADLGSGLAGGAVELAGDRSHAADRHIPVSGLVADHVVQEAAVRGQCRVDVGGEGADERIRQHDAAHEVVAEGVRDGGADGLLDERIPEPVVAEGRAGLRASEQRLGDGGEDGAGQPRGAVVEAVPCVGIRARSDGAERGRRRLCVAVVDEQSAGATGLGCVGGVAATLQADVESEVGDHPLGQQRDEVAVAREPRVDTLEGLRADGRAADVAEALEHDDALARESEVGGGGEPVVAAADDDDVVATRHRAPRSWRARRRRGSSPMRTG